jgi:hypothetical protein
MSTWQDDELDFFVNGALRAPQSGSSLHFVFFAGSAKTRDPAGFLGPRE